MSAAVLVLAAQACAGAAQAAAGDADAIEGVWEFSVTRKDCASGAVLGTQKAFSMFQRGGTLSNDNSTPPSTHGAMFGVWRRVGGASYAVHMAFMRINPDGTLAGTQRVQRDLVLGSDHSITGMVTAQTLDTAGVVVQRGCASETGVRVF